MCKEYILSHVIVKNVTIYEDPVQTRNTSTIKRMLNEDFNLKEPKLQNS